MNAYIILNSGKGGSAKRGEKYKKNLKKNNNKKLFAGSRI